MPGNNTQELIKYWQTQIIGAILYLFEKWRLILLSLVLAGGIGYLMYKPAKPMYTANISFVLSTEQRGNNGLSGLAAQLGFDATTGSTENIFTGDNIIELFKSRSLIGTALLSEVDSVSHQTLLNYIAEHQYTKMYKKAGAFNNNPKTFNSAQLKLYRNIISYVSNAFVVYKKDKKLIFYIISGHATDPKIAYYVAKYMLYQTANFFITTKTNVAATSVTLLKKEADSLGMLLKGTLNSSATMIDRTYNLNPAITVQRSSSQFIQARASAFASAYTEVMRNLEVAKMNLQRETPLYRIIDEPELPLIALPTQSKLSHTIKAAILGILVMLIALITQYFYRFPIKSDDRY